MATLPESPSILGHIFRAKEGHIADTPDNRALLLAVANDASAFVETDANECDWFYRTTVDGSQIWVQVYHGMIVNGGVNQHPRGRQRGRTR